jgi:hypothetical protein
MEMLFGNDGILGEGDLTEDTTEAKENNPLGTDDKNDEDEGLPAGTDREDGKAGLYEGYRAGDDDFVEPPGYEGVLMFWNMPASDANPAGALEGNKPFVYFPPMGSGIFMALGLPSYRARASRRVSVMIWGLPPSACAL